MKRLTTLFLIVLASAAVAAPTPKPTLAGWLDQAWKAERDGKLDAAATAYSEALILRPDDISLNIKVAQMAVLMGSSSVAARQLVRTLDALDKDPKSPVEFKVLVCDVLMGRLPPEWVNHSRDYPLYPAPFKTLPEADKKRIVASMRVEWLFPRKVDEAFFMVDSGQRDQALKLLPEAIVQGDWNGASFLLMNRDFPSATQDKISDEWLSQAKKTGKANMWLAAMQVKWKTGDSKTFKTAFPAALAALKDEPQCLQALRKMCTDMGWPEGAKRVGPTVVPDARPSSAQDAEAAFRAALDSADHSRAQALILAIAADFPDSLMSIMSAANTRQMLKLGWYDLIEKLVQPENLGRLPYDTKTVILADTAFNMPRFDYWMKRFGKSEGSDKGENLLEVAADSARSEASDKGIWLLEQGTRIFPASENIRTSLIRAYNNSGRSDRALSMSRELLDETLASGANPYSALDCLLQAALSAGRTSEVVSQLWDSKDKLPVSSFLNISRHLEQRSKPDEAQKWTDAAVLKAAALGWDKDIEIRAEAGRLAKNPETAAQAEAELKTVSRSSALYNRDTYIQRMGLLLKLEKNDDAQRLLAEAQKIYPDYRFIEHVPGLVRVVKVDYAEEIAHQSERVRKAGLPAFETSPLDSTMRLAYALVKSGKASQADSIAQELLPMKKEWRPGLAAACAFYTKHTEAVMPLVKWLLAVSPRQVYLDDPFKPSTVETVASAIYGAGEKSLARIYVMASVLTAPSDATIFEFDKVKVRCGQISKEPVTPADLAALKQALAKEKLNANGALAMAQQAYSDQALGTWLRELAGSRADSPAVVSMAMSRVDNTVTKTQAAGWAATMENAQDWGGVNWANLSNGCYALASHGLKEEAIRILQAAQPHAPEPSKIYLLTTICKMTGNPPAEPSGQDEATVAAWISYAKVLKDLQMKDDLSQAALKCLELARTASEKGQALGLLAAADPRIALDRIDSMMPEILVKDPAGDPPNWVSIVANALFDIAKSDKTLAPRVVPLLDKATGFSQGMTTNHYVAQAMVRFWAGNTQGGVDVLFSQADDRYGGLKGIFRTAVGPDAPQEARDAIVKRLGEYFKQSKPALDLVSEAVGEIAYQTNSTATAIGLAGKVRDYVGQSDNAPPLSLVSSSLGWLQALGQASKPDPDACRACCDLVETVCRKAASSSDDSRTVARRLRSSLENYKSTGWGGSETFKRVGDLATSLEK